MRVQGTQTWRSSYPGARIGILGMEGVSNTSGVAELAARKRTLEAELRSRYASMDRAQLRLLSPLDAYTAYYKQFGKTYHVQLQLESIVFKGKSIPESGSLVEVMFMAELDSLILTAGHDLGEVHGDLSVGAAAGTETCIGMDGETRILKAQDMYIADQEGVLSSVIYGPARRARLGPKTRRVLYTTYAPSGIEQTGASASPPGSRCLGVSDGGVADSRDSRGRLNGTSR
jgi:DNA/RNA-binding domain of Phe-tRNA-synthetase-like protein